MLSKGEIYHNSANKKRLGQAVATACLVAGSPIASVSALSLMMKHGTSDIFFRQMRNDGAGEREMWKLRTYYSVDVSGKPHTGSRDQRLGKLENFLRVAGIDEYPQLIPVALGQQNLFGLRPLNDEHERNYEDVFGPEYAYLVSKRRKAAAYCSGLLSPANLTNHVYEEQTRQSMIRWFVKDIHYAENATLKTDLSLLARTPLGLLLTAAGLTRSAPTSVPAVDVMQPDAPDLDQLPGLIYSEAY